MKNRESMGPKTRKMIDELAAIQQKRKTMTTGKYDKARAAQLEFYGLRAHDLGNRLQNAAQRNKDWIFREPPGDDPEEWPGIARYMYIERAYAWHVEREANLSRGLGPYWCGNCEERQSGWRQELCYECSWTSYLRDEALANARRLSGIHDGTDNAGKYAMVYA